MVGFIRRFIENYRLLEQERQPQRVSSEKKSPSSKTTDNDGLLSKFFEVTREHSYFDRVYAGEFSEEERLKIFGSD